MQYLTLSALLLSVSGLATATFSSPKAGDKWTIGKENTISWDNSGTKSGGKIDAKLCPKGATDTTIIIADIATQVENSGSFKWTPDKSISAQEAVIIITDETNTKKVSDTFILIVEEISVNTNNNNNNYNSNNNDNSKDNKGSDNSKNGNEGSQKNSTTTKSSEDNKTKENGNQKSTSVVLHETTTKKNEGEKTTTTKAAETTKATEKGSEKGTTKSEVVEVSKTKAIESVVATHLTSAAAALQTQCQVCTVCAAPVTIIINNGVTMASMASSVPQLSLVRTTVQTSAASAVKGTPAVVATPLIETKKTSVAAITSVPATSTRARANAGNVTQATGTGGGVPGAVFTGGASSLQSSVVTAAAAGGIFGLFAMILL